MLVWPSNISVNALFFNIYFLKIKTGLKLSQILFLQNVLSKDVSITEKDIEDQKRDYKDDKRIAFELFRLANLRRDEKGLRYDPWFGFHNFENFANTNPNDIGVIKAKIDMSKVKSYHFAEEEYRVPKEAIVSFEKL